MNPATMIIVAALIAAAVLALRSTLRRVNGGCCGGSDAAAVRRIKVKDKTKDHYPYEAVLAVDGMTCSHCALRVENALNSLAGVYARAEAGKNRADVLMKDRLADDVLRDAVNGIGPYTVLKIERVR